MSYYRFSSSSSCIPTDTLFIATGRFRIFLGLFECFTCSILFIVVDTRKTTAWCLAWLEPHGQAILSIYLLKQFIKNYHIISYLIISLCLVHCALTPISSVSCMLVIVVSWWSLTPDLTSDSPSAYLTTGYSSSPRRYVPSLTLLARIYIRPGSETLPLAISFPNGDCHFYPPPLRTNQRLSKRNFNSRLDVGCRKVTYQPLTSWLPNFSVIISL